MMRRRDEADVVGDEGSPPFQGLSPRVKQFRHIFRVTRSMLCVLCFQQVSYKVSHSLMVHIAHIICRRSPPVP